MSSSDQNSISRRISELRSTSSKVANYLWELAKKHPAESALYMSLIVAFSTAVTKKITEIQEQQRVENEIVLPIPEPQLNLQLAIQMLIVP